MPYGGRDNFVLATNANGGDYHVGEAPDLTTARERRRAIEWENSVLKVKIDQNENFQ